MKKYLSICVAVFVLICSFKIYGAVKIEDSFGTIFNKYIKAGVPDYEKLRKDGVEDLKSVMGKLATFDPAKLSTEDEKIAFWINTYNTFALKVITANYPANDEIFKINGFFDLKSIDVGGLQMSLNTISSDRLLLGKETKDPRINFALFNGTKSSPKLIDGPFTAKKLNEQLEKCTNDFIKDKKNVFLDKEHKVPDPNKLKGIKESEKDTIKKDFTKLSISPIFRWFEEDFKKDSGSVVSFLEKYMDKKDVDYLNKNKDKIVVDYTPYDWTFEGFNK